MAVLTPTFPAAVDTLTTLGQVSNFATTTVGVGGVNASATTVPITDPSAWPSDGACVIGTEAISYTGKTGSSITGCVRGFDGTTAATHAAGDPAYGGAILSAHHEALRDAILALEDVLGANGADLITTLNALYVWRDDYNAKGDILVATAPGIYTPVGVGANGEVLTADSAQTPGLKWAAAAAGGAELVNTTRAVPTTVGNYIDVGTFQTSLGPHNLRVALTVGDSNFSVAKLYDVATQYDDTAGAWRVVRPIADTGPWTTVADYELLLSQSFEVLTLRIRRTLGTGAGVARVRAWEYGTTETFTASSATGTDAASYPFLATNISTHSVVIPFGDGATQIVVGDKRRFSIPVAHTWIGWRITTPTTLAEDMTITDWSEVQPAGHVYIVNVDAASAGSITFDLWGDVAASYPPVVGDSISTSKPTIGSGATNDVTLELWYTR